MTRATVAALAALMVAANPAAAAVTHTSPNNGAATGIHPTFAWVADAGESADYVYITSQERRTPTGEPFEEDRVDTGILGSPAPVTYQPTSALPAGAYWWNVRWHGIDYATEGATTPWAFTIAPSISKLTVRVEQYSSIDTAFMQVGWVSNAKPVTARCRILRGRKAISTDREVDAYPEIGGRNTAQCSVRVRERFDGERLRAELRVTGGGISRTASVRFKAR